MVLWMSPATNISPRWWLGVLVPSLQSNRLFFSRQFILNWFLFFPPLSSFFCVLGWRGHGLGMEVMTPFRWKSWWWQGCCVLVLSRRGCWACVDDSGGCWCYGHRKRIAGIAGLGDVSWRKLRWCGEQWCLSVFWLWTKRWVVWVIGGSCFK